MIANFGNGVDNIDVAAAHARGITVTNTPKVLTEDTADMTMALILAVPRRLIEGASIFTEGKDWAGWSPTAAALRRCRGSPRERSWCRTRPRRWWPGSPTCRRG
jgi:lactate dehydrogenase-like 2-hydroxyacid dehydrogenase